MGKKENYQKKYRDYSIAQLKNEKEYLENTIKICKDYIEAAHNTFLGPLGAVSTIKSSCAKLEVIKDILRRKENRKENEAVSSECRDCVDCPNVECVCKK